MQQCGYADGRIESGKDGLCDAVPLHEAQIFVADVLAVEQGDLLFGVEVGVEGMEIIKIALDLAEQGCFVTRSPDKQLNLVVIIISVKAYIKSTIGKNYTASPAASTVDMSVVLDDKARKQAGEQDRVLIKIWY